MKADKAPKEEIKSVMFGIKANMISELERIADHLVNVAYSIKNPTGDDSED